MIWLIGAGYMGKEYAKILKQMAKEFLVVSRGSTNAEAMEKEFDAKVITGGLAKYLQQNPTAPDYAIVAVSVEELFTTTAALLEFGVKHILLEKPAGLNKDELSTLSRMSKDNQANVYVAYNRRFYASVQKAKEIIEADGGVLSFNFEFTEWSHVISGLNKPQQAFDAWLLANSSHVIDMAFYLGGDPKQMTSLASGKNRLDWHKQSAIFAGCGVSVSGALFSYQANWCAPGRWVVEVLTAKHRLIFKPLEQLFVQKIGSVAVEPVVIDDQKDKEFKPGLYFQVKSFLDGEDSQSIDIHKQNQMFNIYDVIKSGGVL